MCAREKPMSRGADAVVFDLDGVLVSSTPVHYEAFRRTFASEGREFTLDEYLEVGIGAARDVLIRRVLGELSPEKLRELMDAKERHVRKCVEEHGLEAIPGARRFVEDMKRRGLKTAVATASRTPALLLDAAGLGGLFDTVIDRNRIERPKPHPDMYLAAARALGVSPERCIAIEDSPPGIESAASAGMRVIALTTTQPPELLTAADAVVDGFDAIDLSRWLGSGF